MIMILTKTQKEALQELAKGKKSGTELSQYMTAIHQLADKHLVSMREKLHKDESRYWLTPIGKMVYDRELK